MAEAEKLALGADGMHRQLARFIRCYYMCRCKVPLSSVLFLFLHKLNFFLQIKFAFKARVPMMEKITDFIHIAATQGYNTSLRLVQLTPHTLAIIDGFHRLIARVAIETVFTTKNCFTTNFAPLQQVLHCPTDNPRDWERFWADASCLVDATMFKPMSLEAIEHFSDTQNRKDATSAVTSLAGIMECIDVEKRFTFFS